MRTASTRRLLATARRPRGRGRRRHGDRRGRRRSRVRCRRPKPLAGALHDGAHGARRSPGSPPTSRFTNNLIGASELRGRPSDPILQRRHRPTVAVGDHRLRLELQSNNGDAQIVVDQQLVLDLGPVVQHRLQGHAARRSSASRRRRQTKSAATPDDGIPTVAADPDRPEQADEARQRVRRHSRPTSAGQAAYTRQHLAQARRRPARLGRRSPGTRSSGVPLRVGDLRPQQPARRCSS